MRSIAGAGSSGRLGFCLGGGLELALACDRRIAVEDASFGFPEVLLGLHPGFGGTGRLAHLVNPLQAMNMMLTGKTERARKAKSLGLVDAVVPERHVRAAVRGAVSGELRIKPPGFLVRAMNASLARPLIARRMRSETAKQAPKRFYPAPYAMIDLWGGCAAVCALSALGTWAARGYALRRQLVDHPGERRSHQVATPRGGGMAIVGALLVAAAWALWQWPAQQLPIAGAAAGFALVAGIGWWDDHRPLPARWRLAVHALAVLGWGLLGQHLSAAQIAGMAIVVASVWLGQRVQRPAPPAPAARAKSPA